MKTPARSIGPLDKVVIAIKTSSSLESGGDVEERDAKLIFGIGVDGLTPFEKQLFGKSAGDRLELTIEEGCLEDVFGHLRCMLFDRLQPRPPFNLNVTIRSIENAESREIVKALARLAGGCGDGCDCGCGCG